MMPGFKIVNLALTFLGHVIEEKGIQPDSNNTAAILTISTPNDLRLRRLISNYRYIILKMGSQFMRMVDQLGKFSPKIVELSQHS